MIETYDNERDHWRFLRDAHLGGRFWSVPSSTVLGSATLSWHTMNADGTRTDYSRVMNSYLVAHEGESDRQFIARWSMSPYVNIVSTVVKAYADGCTSHVSRQLEPLGTFIENVNRRGQSWAEFADRTATWTAVYGITACIVDAPSVSVEGLTESQRQAKGIAPYCVSIHPSAWAWIECDEDGTVVEFAYVDQPYKSTASSNTAQRISLRVWKADRVDDAGKMIPGSWSACSVSVANGQTISGSRDSMKVVKGGPLPAQCGGKIPVTFAYFDCDDSQVCPQGISLIADVADIGKSIYNILSWAHEILRKTGFPFLAIPMKSTGGQLDSGTAAKIGPGNGLGFDSNTGAPSWIQPSAESTQELRVHCIFLFQWALRSVGLELAADQSAQVSSGEALRIRSRDFESRAQKFARNMQRWETATLDLLARMGGVPESEIEKISVAYPKRITLPDQTEDLARAIQLLTMPVEIGAEARALAVIQAVDAALSLPDDKLSEIASGLMKLYGADIEAFGARQQLEELKARQETALLSSPQDVPPTVTLPAATDAAPVADTALNGAQVSSLMDLLSAASDGSLPIDTVQAMIAAAFPSMDSATVANMLTPIRTRGIQAPPAKDVTGGSTSS